MKRFYYAVNLDSMHVHRVGEFDSPEAANKSADTHSIGKAQGFRVMDTWAALALAGIIIKVVNMRNS